MNVLFLIIKEYLSITQKLTQAYKIENERIIIERDDFKKMLERYAFTSFAEKVKAYKALNFIIYDNNNYTMPYKDKELKKTVRKVIINYKTYDTINELFKTSIEE